MKKQGGFRMGWWVGVGAALVLKGCGGGSGGGGSGSGTIDAGLFQKAAEQQAAAQAPAAEQGVAGAGSQPTRASVPANTMPAPLLIEPKISTGPSAAEISPIRKRPPEDAPKAHDILLPAPPAEATNWGTLQKSRSLSSSSAVSPSSAGPTPPQALGPRRDAAEPARIGLGRSIEATGSSAGTMALLDWSASPRGGQVAALRFGSVGAEGVRVGLLVKSLPLGGVVRFYGRDPGEVFEVPAQEINQVIQRNIDAGDMTDAARTYWSPQLDGDAITVEFEVPADTPTDLVEVSVPKLSHIAVGRKDLQGFLKAGGNCYRDVSCTSSYNELSKSVAMMVFTDAEGEPYSCTGTLLNDRMSSGTPYFLSANHCIPSQTVASTLVTLWSYKSASCNNTTDISENAQALSGGATLLYANTGTDTSFMRLNGTPPTGAVYAGSSSFALDWLSWVHGVHHPEGEPQRYSEGTYQGFARCEADGYCYSGTAANSKHLAARWTWGATGYGSSGSGLFVQMNGKDYLVGQLEGGSASCSNPLGYDFYGRFDLAYNSALHQWLGASSGTVRVPVYRLYNNKTGTHFYTLDPAERDRAVEKWREFTYEGVGFYAYGTSGMANNTVYRFYNTRTNAHFFTISRDEQEAVLRKYPWYHYEGVSWYANTSSGSGATQMYRFYNKKTATHFYTISQAERDQVIARYPHYIYEGVGYYAWTYK